MPKFFETFTLTSAAIPGVASALGSGVLSGFSQSILAAKKAAALLSEKSGQRDSLLEALKVLFDDPDDIDHSVLNAYLEELRGGLIATNDAVALIVRNALLSVLSGAGHIVQIPSDVVTVVKETGKGLTNIQVPADDMYDASKKAFTFDVEEKGASHSVSSVAEMVSKKGDEVMGAVDKAIDIEHNSHAAAHAQVAASTGAGASIATTAALPTAVALLTNTIGQIFREGSAIRHFSANESESAVNQKNVYHASTGVAKATQNSGSPASQQPLIDLEEALSHLDPAAKLMSDQSVTSPLTTALLRLIVLSLFVESSRGINKTAIAVSEGRIQKALAKATAQGPSGGVDRINSLHANLCSLSNLMRLCAENLDDSSTVKIAAQSSEVISSRSMSVLLSHVSELAVALRQLVNPQQQLAVNSSLDSAKPEILDRFGETIKNVLDQIEQANEQHVIPGLNQDMASQLNTVAHTTVSSFVATHSIFSNPVLLAAKGSKEAAKTEEAEKNEALMATLPGMTQMLNTIQASTRNFIDAMAKDMESGLKEKGSLLSTHKSVGSSSAAGYLAASAIVLLCDEMLSICRSLTLIDQNRLRAASQKASQVPSKDESAQSREQISWDSHLGQDYSSTHAITALRLTLSHTGIALMRIALDLHHALKDDLDTVQQNLAMHTLQRSVLSASAYASFYLAEGLLLSTGAASASLVSLNGSVNSTHKKIHATDAHLHPAQTHNSEDCSKKDSQSSQATGFSTDLVAGTVTNILKVLAQGSLIGMDTVLKLIKLLEIISLHRDSHIALQLESHDSSNPNGLLINTLSEPCVGSSAGTGAILMNILAAFQTLDECCGTQSTLYAQNRLQDVLDQQIEGIAALNDDEEQQQGKKGLKEFYKIIIHLLSPTSQESERNSLVNRLHFGGISLSSYHSKFGAYSIQPEQGVQPPNNLPLNSNFGANNAQYERDLVFLKQFNNADDAQGILCQFIDKAKGKFSLLRSLYDALPQEQMSEKTKVLYAHVFEAVYQHYKQIKMSDIARHDTSRRKPPTRDDFQRDIGLVQVQPEVDVNPSNGPGYRQ